jgi:hypothetical protein
MYIFTLGLDNQIQSTYPTRPRLLGVAVVQLNFW